VNTPSAPALATAMLGPLRDVLLYWPLNAAEVIEYRVSVTDTVPLFRRLRVAFVAELNVIPIDVSNS